MRVAVADAHGNQAVSSWSEPYTVAPPLRVEHFTINRPSPQMAGTGPVTWGVEAVGGVGDLNITFELEENGRSIEPVPQSGSPATWIWPADQPGSFRVRAVIEDALGNLLQSRSGMDSLPACPAAGGTGTSSWKTGAADRRHHPDQLGGGGHRRRRAPDLPLRVGERRPGRRSHSDRLGARLGLATGRGWGLPRPGGGYRSSRQPVGQPLSRSAPYEIAPPLVIGRPAAGIPSPQMAGTVAIPWEPKPTEVSASRRFYSN